MFEIHDLYCRRFLHHFEEAQEKMLNLLYLDSAREFELLYDCFNRECEKGIHQIIDKLSDQKEALLLTGQLQKICQYIREFSDTAKNLQDKKLKPSKIITHFEEQHQFKKILIRHVTDLERIMNNAG